MKNKFGILLIVLFFSGTAFAQYQSCASWGAGAAEAESQHYGITDGAEIVGIWMWYEAQCEAAGGTQNMLDPVFL